MAVYINARFLSQPVTGVQRYAENITRELFAIRDGIRLLAPLGRSVPWVAISLARTTGLRSPLFKTSVPTCRVVVASAATVIATKGPN